MNNSGVRNRAIMGREESATSEGEEFALIESEQQGNDATRRSPSVHSESNSRSPRVRRRIATLGSATLQQLSNLQHFWSWRNILPTVIAIIIVAWFAISLGSRNQTIEQLENDNKQIRQSLDSRDQTIEQLQNENNENLSMVEYLQNELAHMKKALQDSKSQCNSDILKSEERCFQEKQNAKEIYRTDMDEMKEKYRTNMDETKEKYRTNMDETKEKCRSDMDETKEKCRSDMDETKEKCRSDMDETKEKCREDKGNIENKIRLWKEDIDLLIECLARKKIAPAGNIFSAVFNIIWGAVQTEFGSNSDVEECLKQFNDRFQRRLPA